MAKRQWQQGPRPTGQLSEAYLDSALYGEEGDVLPLLIGPAVEQYHAEFAHRCPSTAWHVAHSINHLLLTVGLHENSMLSDITREKIQLYKSRCMEGTAPRSSPQQRVAKAPTLKKRFGEIKAWLAWCEKQGHIDKNPALALELPARMVSKEKVKKSGFTDAQLATIFRLLAPYRTVPSPIPAKENPPMRIEWYWCILCLAFTGARRAEIAQLLRSDVREIDGVWCFSLDESEEDEGEETKKALKNAPSKRLVVIHSQLLEAGFLQWFNTRPSSGRVFPLLCDAGFGKITLWFSYFLKKNGLKTPALSLHSFRHTMTVKLELAKTHGSLMRRLLGHSLGNDVESRVYLGSLTYDVKELQMALEAVKFPPVPK